MTLRCETIEETTVTRDGYNDPAPKTQTTIRHNFTGRACVSLTHSAISIDDPYGEQTRQTVSYWGDSDHVADAVVDFVHALKREVDRAAANGCVESSPSAARCLETLRRVAGELGLSFNVNS